MDLSSAEKYVNKLLEYVQDLSSSNCNMYQKSRTRLKSVAFTCDQVIKIISDILKDEVLVDDHEFQEAPSEDILSVVASMQTELQDLKRYVNFQDSSTRIIQEDKKSVLIKYGNILQSVADSNIKYSVVSSCASLIWRWFKCRFFETSKMYSSFHYNIQKFPIWIRDIVILYGSYASRHDEVILETKFNDWCESLTDPKIGGRYAIPYELYKFNQFMKPEDFTLTSVILWDILLDSGYRKLCTLNPNDSYLCDDSVYKLCGQFNPVILDEYVDYKSDPSILVRCNLGDNHVY